MRTQRAVARKPALRAAGSVTISAIGAVCLGLSAWKVTFAGGGAESTALIVAGALLIVCPLLLGRLLTLAVSTDGFEFKFAEQIAEAGAESTARTVDHTELAALADAYGTIRRVSSAEHEKIRVPLQDLLVDQAEALAESAPFDPAELRQLYPKATPVLRVLILGLMKGNTALADFDVIRLAIRQKQSNNEQYHALLLAERCWENLAPSSACRFRSCWLTWMSGQGLVVPSRTGSENCLRATRTMRQGVLRGNGPVVL